MMMKRVLTIGFACVAGMASGAVSTHFALDNRTGVRVAESVEQIRYSPAWETEAASAIAQVSTNGVVVASASEAGTFAWTPTRNGTYEFTHVVAVNGSRVGETLSATFEVTSCPIHYTLKFDANGGIGTMTDSDFIVGVEKCLPMNAFVREGYTFGGWGMAANSVAASYQDGEAVTDVCKLDGAEDTLYALWIPNVITVTFNYGPFAEKFAPCEYTYTVGTAFHDFPYVTSSSWEVKGWFTEMMGGVQYQPGDVLPFTKNGTLFLQAEYKGTNPNPGDDLGDTQTNTFGIVTVTLPSATEMVSYEAQLACWGGTEPYRWSVSDETYLVSTGTCSFAEVGEAQGWYEDDGEWKYDLPFAFNYCGRSYDSVVVHDNAYLTFENGSEEESVETGFGDLYSDNLEQDVFIDRQSDQVTFRWKRVRYSERTNEVNCAITLYSNGVVRCAFGECYATTRDVWLSNLDSAVVESSQEGNEDVTFTPNYLPSGLSLDADGIISGVPTQAGHYEFDVCVEDDEGLSCTKRLAMEVGANPNRRPVVEDWTSDLYDEAYLRGGEDASFAVEVSDPDGDALTYRWYWDGEEIEGATEPTYELMTDTDMRGRHTLACEVSDGVWTIPAHEWEMAVGGEISVSADDGVEALQNALNEAISGDVIYVEPGTYSSIEPGWLSGVRIVATEGPASTFIDGGCTSACVRVGWSCTTNVAVRIEGFTLENGLADYGGGARGAWLIGCVVRCNEAEECGGGMYGCRADSCLIAGNSAADGGGAYCSELHNCTVTDNVATDGAGGVRWGSLYNSIVWGNEGTDDDSNVEDPLFVDAENGDYSLDEGSPCIGMGENSDVVTAYDLAGNIRIQNGSVDLGAYESAYELPLPEEVSWLSVDSLTYGIQLTWSDTAYAKWYEVYRVEDSLDDDAGEVIATVSERLYTDYSAQFGTDYRYWVVPCNESGMGHASESGVGGLLEPLEIIDSELPGASVGSPYEYALLATGGDESYDWTIPAYSLVLESESTFAEVGEPMGWTEDDARWSYELPFAFPVGDSSTNLVTVSDNGELYIETDDGYLTVYAANDTDLYADPGDIYVAVTNDAVTFRWKRVIFDTSDVVNVSATLYANGRVRLRTEGDSTSVFRGFEDYDNSECWGTDGDIVLIPNKLPAGLGLDLEGVVSGTPARNGTYRFDVKVSDGNGESAIREITMTIGGSSADPIPDLGATPTSAEVYEALAGSADVNLQECITDGTSYRAYREWANEVKTFVGTAKAGALAVRNSPNAWLSFALGSSVLIAEEPKDGDLNIDDIKPSDKTGEFEFTVSVDGIEIGADAKLDNLRKVFVLEGAETLDADSFSSANLDYTLGATTDGRVKFIAWPTNAEVDTFFIRVKMTTSTVH